MNVVRWIYLWLLSLASCASASNNDIKAWRTYRVVIPHFYVEYKIPPNLRAGHGGQESEVSFEALKGEDPPRRFGKAAYQSSVATFYYGVVGDFTDFDMTVEVSALKFKSQQGVKSVTELLAYVRQVLSEPYVLKTGKAANNLGKIVESKIASYDVVVATAADMQHIAHIDLSDKSTLTLPPYQYYYMRLDDETVLVINVQHFTQSRLDLKWYANAEAMVVSIIQNMKIIPRPVQ